MPTFIVKNNPGFSNPLVLDDEDNHHLIDVIRAKAGEIFSVTDNQGHIADIKIKKTRPLECEVIRIKNSEPPAPLTLCLSLFQMNRMEWAVQKLCELNIRAIRFIVSERCQFRELSESKMDRLKKIAIEAQKQCGRAWPLELLPCLSLQEFKFEKDHACIVGAITDNASKKIMMPAGKPVFIFVGPEGDFTSAEYDFLQKKQAQFVDLGEIILKSETAAIVLASLTKYSMENSHV